MAVMAFDSSDAQRVGRTCLGLHVRRAARRLARVYDEALAPAGLTIGQFSLLAMLAGQDAWAMQPLADALSTDRSSLTAALKPLERRGLIASSPDADDRRLRFVSLTERGAMTMGNAEPLWLLAQAQAEALLGGDDAENFRRTLRALA